MIRGQKKFNYDHEALRRLMRSTGLTDQQIAQLVGAERNAIYKALNKQSASSDLVYNLVHIANTLLHQRAIEAGQEYRLVDWREFLPASPPPTGKILSQIVS